MKKNIIETITIYNLLNALFNILDNYLEDSNKKNELDELSECIYSLTINSYQEIKSTYIDEYNTIYEKIKKLSNMKLKTFVGITSKCIFKHMDLIDEIS